MREVRRGRVDIVVCHALDRLARSLSHLVQLLDEFATHRTALIVPAPTSTPRAKFRRPATVAHLGRRRSVRTRIDSSRV